MKDGNTDALKAKYTSVLEDYYAVSKECKELQERFNAEYNFAEEKLREVELYKEFIDSNEDIKKSYDEFIESKSPKEDKEV